MLDETGEHIVVLTGRNPTKRVRVFQLKDAKLIEDRLISRVVLKDNDERLPLITISGFTFALHLDQPLISLDSSKRTEALGNIVALPQHQGPNPTLAIAAFPSGDLIQSIPLERRGLNAGFILPNGTVLIPEEGGVLQAFDVHTGQELPWKSTQPTNTALPLAIPALSPNECIFGTNYGKLIWIDGRYGEVLSAVQDTLWPIKAGSFQPHTKELFTIDQRGNISVWHHQGDPFVLHGHEHWIDPVVISENGNTLISGDWEGSIRTWNLNQLAQSNEYRVPPSGGLYTVIDDLSIAPNGEHIAVASSAGWTSPHVVEIRDRVTGAVLKQAARVEQSPVHARYHPDGRLFFTSREAHATVLDTNTVHIGNAITHAIFSSTQPDIGAVVVRHGDVQSLRIFDTNTLETVFDVPSSSRTINDLCFSPDGTRVLTAGEDRTIQVWSVSNGTILTTLTGHSDSVLGVAWSPDGTRIATTGRDATIRIWDGISYSHITVLRGHRSYVNSVAWTPNGSQLISSSSDRSIRIWATYGVSDFTEQSTPLTEAR